MSAVSDMSSHSLALTASGSSSTLVAGMQLAGQSLPNLIRAKEEDLDDEEQAIYHELQDRLSCAL